MDAHHKSAQVLSYSDSYCRGQSGGHGRVDKLTVSTHAP